MKVYRIEHFEKLIGPYQLIYRLNDSELQKILGNHKTENKRPCWHNDKINRVTQYSKSGFFDIESLKQWFNDCIERLKENNFVLSIYEINYSYVKFGKFSNQVVFDERKAERIAVLNI